MLSSSVLVAQNTCETKEGVLENLNSIHKCSVTPSATNINKSKRQVSASLSVSKNRFLKRRVTQNKMISISHKNSNTSILSDTNQKK